MLQDNNNANVEKFKTWTKEVRILLKNKKKRLRIKYYRRYLEEDAKSNSNWRFFEEISKMKKGYKPISMMGSN